jgi:transcriptional regulator with XRE-family HTH domain
MTTSTPSPSGDRVRMLRGHQGLTQTDLASKAGISPTTIATMETGERRVRPATVRRIARALGVSPAELFDADEVAATPKNQPLREGHSEPTAGDSSFGEPYPSVRYWRIKLEALAKYYQEAEKELRNSDLSVCPDEAIDAEIWASYELPSLRREEDEVREDPDVIAAVEKIQSARASVERMLNQRFEALDDAHAQEINRFLSTEKNEPLSGDDRANAG